MLHLHKLPLRSQNHSKLLLNHITTNILVHNKHVAYTTLQQQTESRATLMSTFFQGGLNRDLVLCNSSNILNSDVKPDAYPLIHLLRASTDQGLESCCQQLHSYILKSGFGSNVHVSNALLRFYKELDFMNVAYKLFVEIAHPNVVSWNSLISGYVHSGKFRKALDLFLQLEKSDVCADAYSFTAALSACGQLGLLLLGRLIHCRIVKSGVEFGVFVGNCLIDMYGKCGSVEEAIWIFDEMIDKDVISWNSVIAASARNRRPELAYSFFYQMPNPDTISYNELINGIAQFGDIEDAIKILSNMLNPNSSSWNSIITGYVNRDRSREALDFFAKMHSSDVKMDEFTFSILLSGIAGLAALRWGMLIHCCVMKSGLDSSVVIGSALVDMYSKCGQTKNAESMFWSLPKRNLVTWNAMISGYAQNGNPCQVIRLFEEVLAAKDLKPDSVTYLNVIAACSNTDVPLQKALWYFESMINDYEIEPTVEHCCSMIRLMGQRGEVWRAVRMIYDLGFGSCGVVWRALLGASGACRDLKVASIAAAKLIQLEGDDDYVYVMISNIFACYGNWGHVSKVRKFMNERGVRKEVGFSWIEVEEPS